MDAAEKRQRDLDLLRKSRQALDEGELVDRHAPAPAPEQVERRQAPPKEGDPDVVMYRGKAIRRSSGSGGAKSGARGTSFRGAQVGGRPKSGAKPASNTDVRAILERLNGLYKDGLITKAEYDRKRSQILDRL